MSGVCGKDGLLPKVTRPLTGHHLLTRQPPQLIANEKVLLDHLAISEVKQQLPTFYAIELTSLNKYFAQTVFEKQPLVKLSMVKQARRPWLQSSQSVKPPGDGKKRMMVTLKDEDHSVPKRYKERKLRVLVEDVAGLLENITGRGIIHSLTVDAKDHRLKLLLDLETEKLTPTHVEFCEVGRRQNYFLPLVERLASTGKVQSLEIYFDISRVNWPHFAQCLSRFTTLQQLQLSMTESQPPLDLLDKAVLANGELKRLQMDGVLFFEYDYLVSSALPTVASVGTISIDGWILPMVLSHVKVDLNGSGQSTLTKLVQYMPNTGRLEMRIEDDGERFKYRDVLCVCRYLLSLSGMGNAAVVVGMDMIPLYRIQKFIKDLDDFFPGQMDILAVKVSTLTNNNNNTIRHRYKVRVDNVTIKLDGYRDKQRQEKSLKKKKRGCIIA